MKTNLLTFLICASLMVISQQSRAQSMVAIHDDNGRAVWVNNDGPPTPTSGSPAAKAKPNYRKLVYWSRAESRWKAVPTPSVSTMKAAKQAAQEVTTFVAAAPVLPSTRTSSGSFSPETQDLVKGKQSVIQYQAELGWPFASISDYKNPGDYAMFLLYKPNFTSKQIVDQAQEEIAKIQNDGVDIMELERARTLLRSERITSLQSSFQRASLLAGYEVLDGNPEYVNTELERFLTVTSEQIQAAAKKYLTPERRSVLDILPGPAPQAPSPKESK